MNYEDLFWRLYQRDMKRRIFINSNLIHNIAFKIWDIPTWNEIFELFTAH